MSDLQRRLWESGWAILPLRLMLGFGFAAHGYAKLSRGPENFAVILAAIGVPQPNVVAWVTSLIEFVGVALASWLEHSFSHSVSHWLLVMLTALFSVHFQYGFSSIRLKAVTASGAEFGPIGYEIESPLHRRD